MHVTMRWPPPLRPGLTAGCSRLPHLRWRGQKAPFAFGRVSGRTSPETRGTRLFGCLCAAYAAFMTRANDRKQVEESRGLTAVGRAQPRPAFGLRPWFALLRRARSLRRFAFAIVSGSVPGGRPYRPGRSVVLATDRWRSLPITVAITSADRLVGMRHPGRNGVLLKASSVHAAGLVDALRVVHVDAEEAQRRVDAQMPVEEKARRAKAAEEFKKHHETCPMRGRKHRNDDAE